MKKIFLCIVFILISFNIISCGKKSALSPPIESEYPKKFPPE
jgi:hypothetical protein